MTISSCASCCMMLAGMTSSYMYLLLTIQE